MNAAPTVPGGIPAARKPRRGASPAVRGLVLSLFAMAIVLALDSAIIEPSWIEVTRFSVAAPVPRPIRIAHLTDLHTRGIGFRERRLLELLEQEKPDLIAITGDVPSNEAPLEMSRSLLARLHAQLGVWVVRGNWEIWQEGNKTGDFFRSLGFHYLQNESAELFPGVWIVGLDDPRAGSPDIYKAFDGVPPGSYTLTLVHAPIILDMLARKTNLVLAGHTHGGQVRLPWIGPLWLPPGCGSYVAGWYERSGTRMYISRGIGTSVLPIRFLSRPELDIITLGR
jgi:predicted MPP superfamily phosphohydrolase